MTMEYPNPQRVPMVDPKTGMVSREWLIFFERRLGITGTNSIIKQIIQAADFSPISMPYMEASQRLDGLEKDIQSLPLPQLLTDIQAIFELILQTQQTNESYLLQEIESLRRKILEIEQTNDFKYLQDIEDLQRSVRDLQQGVTP